MNPAHFHLLLNHLPIIFPIVGLLVLVGGIFFKLEIVKRVAYLIFITGALLALPALASGDGAEEAIENLPEISHQMIHAHEEAAQTFAMVAFLLGAVSTFALWISIKSRPNKWIPFVVLVVGLFAMFLAQKTGTSGGEIRHTEIR